VAVHIYTQTIQRTTQIQTNVVECGPCPIFASFTLAFALQLRKRHGKTSVTVQYTYYQEHPHITKPSQTNTLQTPLIHTLQNNIKPPQYKLKQNAYRKRYDQEQINTSFPWISMLLTNFRVRLVALFPTDPILSSFFSILTSGVNKHNFDIPSPDLPTQ
jgi:hypothetical protein